MATEGWYPDPAQRHASRYWDGARWTEHVADGGQQSVDPLPAEPGAAVASGGGNVAGDLGGGADAGETAQLATTDPRPFHEVLSKLSVAPMPAGDGTCWGEPILLFVQSELEPEKIEWWTPSGVRVAYAQLEHPPGSDDYDPYTWADEKSGEDISSRFRVDDGYGRPIAVQIHALKLDKAPIFIDDPQGNRLIEVKPGSGFRTPRYDVELASGASMHWAADSFQAPFITVNGPDGQHLATVVRHGDWAADEALEVAQKAQPYSSPSDRLARANTDLVIPSPRPGMVMSVLIRPQLLGQNDVALATLLSPLVFAQNKGLR